MTSILSSCAFADFAPPISPPTPLRSAITAACRRSERASIEALLEEATMPSELRGPIRDTARELVSRLRSKRRRCGVEALIQEYALSSEEGVALMCLAEALLRIPDTATRDALIRDKVAGGDWSSHKGEGRSLFVNAATWGLVFTGKLVQPVDGKGLSKALSRLLSRAGEPVIRKAVETAMRLLGEQFVTGETIEEALERSKQLQAKGFTFSYDMLGEAAATSADADRYFKSYSQAIHAIGKANQSKCVYAGAGISIKLSALHPRYCRAQAERVMGELLPRVRKLASLARTYNIGLNLDAEEADRMELSLDLFEALALDPGLKGWAGLGFVVQAYSKRSPFVIDWLIDLARRSDRRIMVRLVKGAYWDAEIKRAQVDGLKDFPVFTRKVHTDLSYIACARKLLGNLEHVFPQFATHNAHSLSAIYHLAGPDFVPGDWEFQCLHGMGEPLYEEVVGLAGFGRPCRIYAPVGNHETLLAYLVRRLLENGANSSFVNRIGDVRIPIDTLISDPAETVRHMPNPGAPHEAINPPDALFETRPNSTGIDLSDESELIRLNEELKRSASHKWSAGDCRERARSVRNPADARDVVGQAFDYDPEAAPAAVARAAGSGWSRTPVEDRAAILERAAGRMQDEMAILIGLLIREAGKSAANGIAEVREAIDFLRYYAAEARAHFTSGTEPLGPIVCISPWNFPLAIFTGQVAAALAAGNPVVAKPASDTPLIAAEAVRILHDAGVPKDALQLFPGSGRVGAALVAARETAGVIFTGSTGVAKSLQQQLAGRLSSRGTPIPLIAETGGQNAMIVDSSALTEQVVADVISSAFDSAGQRCSALRVLCLQEDIADRTLEMLRGAMRELAIGRPDRLSTDVGPVINANAKAEIEGHVAAMMAKGRNVHRLELPEETDRGIFVAPTIVEIQDIAELTNEVFGPVLHVLRFERKQLGNLINSINATGYGLTFGLHTRLDETVEDVTSRIRAGNLYINRNTIGAVVGVQPFGGRGLSGTGPKAGGPLYLRRLVHNPPRMEHGNLRNPALDDFIGWLRDQGDEDVASFARKLARESLSGLKHELTGPVGESNVYHLHSRGHVILRPTTEKGLRLQIAAALAAGCEAIVDGFNLPEGLPVSVGARVSEGEGQDACVALLDAADERMEATLQELTQRPGPIVSAYVVNPSTFVLDGLFEEISISTNTTAAGGNASLIMIA